MKKVSSAPDLQSLKPNAVMASVSVHSSLTLPPKSFVKSINNGSLVASSPLSSTTPHAFAMDHQTPIIPNSDEVAFAVASKGLISATECLASIDIAEAPDLVDNHISQFDVASCLSTPAIPDQNNGELVQQRAARLGAHAEMQLRLRYCQEISGAAVRSMPARIRSRLGRKRSLDDLDLHEALMYADNTAMQDLDVTISPLPATTSTSNKSSASNNLMTASMDDVSNRHRLELDTHPEPSKPDESIILEEPDHEYLVGGSTVIMNGGDGISNDDEVVVVGVVDGGEKDRKKSRHCDDDSNALSGTSRNTNGSSNDEKRKKEKARSNVMPFRRTSLYARENFK